MKTIAIVDPIWGGHHPFYLKIFTKALLEFGYRVLVFCKQPDEIQEYINKYDNLTQDNQLYTFFIHDPYIQPFLIPQISRTMVAKQRWKISADIIQKAVTQIGYVPDLVFFAWLDSYLGLQITPQWVDQVFPYNWSGLYFQPHYLRVRREWLFIRRRFLSPDFALNSKNCKVITVLDEGIAEELQNIKNKPVIVFPDLADESLPDPDYSVAQQIREKARGRKVIGLLGSLHKRKGLMTLLEVSQKIINEDYFFVFAGLLAETTFHPQELNKIQHIIQQKPDNCFFYLKKIPDGSLFNALVNECEIIFVAYQQFPYSSNLLTKAAIFQKPVIATEDFCIGERVKKFNTGITIQSGNVQECIETLHLFSKKKQLNYKSFKSNFEKYQLHHSYQQLDWAFKKVLSLAIES
jgi:glycosyltransferase involved in cell wall biosynthesis